MNIAPAWRIPLFTGIAAMLVMGLAVPFSEGTGTGQRWFFAALIGLLAAYGAWSFGGLFAMISELFRRRQPASARPVQHQGPMPELSASRRAAVRRVVGAMADHELFAPDVPAPELLYPGIADMDETVQPDSVLSALCEIDYYHPGVDPARFGGNLLMFDSKTEQDADYLRAMVVELARLSELEARDVSVETDWTTATSGSTPVRIALTLAGEPLTIAYAGAIKYGSTHLPHAIAARLDAAGTGKRLAWLWTDQGAWISCLADGAVEALNSRLKLTGRSRCQWDWVSEAEPFAAGDPAPGRQKP